MFRLAHPEYLYILFAMPVMIAIYVFAHYRRKRHLKHFGETKLVRQLMPEYSSSRPVIKLILALLAFMLLVFALARPQFGSKLKEVKREGIELIIALDVSNSMNATDVKPSRLKRAKRAIEKLVNDLNDDMIGLVVFAGDAMVQLPITNDYASAKMFLSSIDTDIIPVQGTAIGKALRLTSSSFTQDEEASKVIILLTDGENHEDGAVEAAEAAYEKGIIVYSVGMGTKKGSPIPARSGRFKKDESGNVVISKLDEDMLSRIAAAGHGKYVLAGSGGSGLDMIIKEIGKMQKSEKSMKVYSEFDDQYQYPLALALLILLVEAIVMYRANEKLKSFKPWKD